MNRSTGTAQQSPIVELKLYTAIGEPQPQRLSSSLTRCVQHDPTAGIRGLKDERDSCGVVCGLRRHTIAQTGVSIKSQGHIDLEEEGEGRREKEKGEKDGEGEWR